MKTNHRMERTAQYSSSRLMLFRQLRAVSVTRTPPTVTASANPASLGHPTGR
jgi:hypothetical protein